MEWAGVDVGGRGADILAALEITPNKKLAHRAFKAFSPPLAAMVKQLMQMDPTNIDDSDGDDDEQEAVDLARKWVGIIDSAFVDIKQESSLSPSWIDTRHSLVEGEGFGSQSPRSGADPPL